MAESTREAVERENRRLQEEIQKVMMHNTKLQRELMALNASREQIVAEGHERVATLTDELKQVDAELRTVRGDCDRIIAVICELKQNSIVRSLGDLASTPEMNEEDDFQSDHSTASTASTSSFRSTRSASRGGGDAKGKGDASSNGRPPLSKKMSFDIDAERVPLPSTKSSSAKAAAAAQSAQAATARDTIMSRISRSVKKAQSMPMTSSSMSSPAARPSVQHSIESPGHSPMLSYKANAVLRATQTHLNNFRRHSGPYRRNRDTVVL